MVDSEDDFGSYIDNLAAAEEAAARDARMFNEHEVRMYCDIEAMSQQKLVVAFQTNISRYFLFYFRTDLETDDMGRMDRAAGSGTRTTF